jgi:hypothetical protein
VKVFVAIPESGGRFLGMDTENAYTYQYEQVVSWATYEALDPIKDAYLHSTTFYDDEVDLTIETDSEEVAKLIHSTIIGGALISSMKD